MKRERSIGIVVHSPRTVRIALGDRGTEAGGGELQLAWTARLLRDRGWRVSLIVPAQRDEVQVGEIGGFNVIQAHQPGRGSGLGHYLSHTLRDYWRALAAADAAIYLHRGANIMAGWTAAYCRLHGRCAVLSAASNLDVAPGLESGERTPSRAHRALYGYFLNNCATVLAQSEEQVELYRQRSGRQAHIVPNAVEIPEELSGLRSPRPLVAWAGAIRACKRPLWVLEIARRLPDVEFRIAGGPNPGEEPLWEDLQQRAQSLPNLTLLGWLDVAGVERLIGEAWVCLCTSQMEGFPNVYLMAWSQETPVVTSFSAGGLAETSGGGIVGSTPNELAEAIRGLVANPAIRSRMGQNGRAYTINRHGPDAVGDRYDNLLSALVGLAPASQVAEPAPIVAVQA